MPRKTIALALGAALAMMLITWGAAVALHPESQQAAAVASVGPSADPTPTATPQPFPTSTPTTTPSPSPSPVVTPEPAPAAAPAVPAPAAPAPPAHPTDSAFGEIVLNIAPAPPFTVGTRTVAIQGDVRLAAGATFSCSVDIGGTSWPTEGDYLGAEWVGDFHVFLKYVDVSLAPADYPFTATCSTSDGASWSGSGFADAARWTGITA